MRTTNRLITAAILMACPLLLWAQISPQFDFFPDQTFAHCMFLQEDTLWAGTRGSLVKRDAANGEVLAVWDTRNSPLNTEIRDVWIDSLNRVWMALGENGVAMKAGENWQFWTADELNITGVTPEIQMIAVDEFGKVWAYDQHNQRITWFNGNQWTDSGLTGTEIGYPQFIQDPQKRLWWVGNGKVNRYQNNTWQYYQSNAVQIATAVFRPNGQLYAGTSDQKVYRIQTSGSASLVGVFGDFSTDPYRMSVDSLGKLFIANAYAYWQFTGSAWIETAFPYSSYLNDEAPNRILNDRFGNKWISRYYSSTLQRFHDGALYNITSGIVAPNEIQKNTTGKKIWYMSNTHFISSIDVDDLSTTEHPYTGDMDALLYNIVPGETDSTMWGACGDGLMYFDGQTWSLVPDPTPGAKQYLYRVVKDNQHNLLCFTSFSDFKIYQPATGTWTPYVMGQNGVPPELNWTVFQEPNGRLWFPGGQGISSFYDGQWTYLDAIGSGLPNAANFRVGVSNDGTLWTAHDTELYRYDGTSWTLAYETDCFYTWNHFISDFFVDSRGWLWVLSGCGTFSVFDGQSWQVFDPSNTNLGENYFYRITEDYTGNIWMSGTAAIRINVGAVAAHNPGLDAPAAFSLQPNPATDATEIRISLPGTGRLDLTDAQGRTLRTIQINGAGNYGLEREALPAGVYFIRYTGHFGQVQTEKLIFH